MSKTKEKYTLSLKLYKNVFYMLYTSSCLFFENYVKNPDVAKGLVQDIFKKVWEDKIEFRNELVNSEIAKYLETSVKGIGCNLNTDTEITQKEIAYKYLTTPRGRQFQVTLFNWAHAWLNSESKLKYPVPFVKEKPRFLELIYGEAYFNMSSSTKHNRSKFQIINKEQTVEVLGTEFNIKAYKDEVNVYTTLVEGKEVLLSSGDTIKHLIPNEKSNLNTKNNLLEVTQVEVYSDIVRKVGVFNFENKPFKYIIKVLPTNNLQVNEI